MYNRIMCIPLRPLCAVPLTLCILVMMGALIALCDIFVYFMIPSSMIVASQLPARKAGLLKEQPLVLLSTEEYKQFTYLRGRPLTKALYNRTRKFQYVSVVDTNLTLYLEFSESFNKKATQIRNTLSNSIISMPQDGKLNDDTMLELIPQTRRRLSSRKDITERKIILVFSSSVNASKASDVLASNETSVVYLKRLRDGGSDKYPSPTLRKTTLNFIRWWKGCHEISAKAAYLDLMYLYDNSMSLTSFCANQVACRNFNQTALRVLCRQHSLAVNMAYLDDVLVTIDTAPHESTKVLFYFDDDLFENLRNIIAKRHNSMKDWFAFIKLLQARLQTVYNPTYASSFIQVLERAVLAWIADTFPGNIMFGLYNANHFAQYNTNRFATSRREIINFLDLRHHEQYSVN